MKTLNTVKTPKIEDIKTRGHWTKFRGEWMVSLSEKFDESETFFEEYEECPSWSEEMKYFKKMESARRFVVVETRAGKEQIVLLGEYEHSFTGKYGESHIYDVTPIIE